MCKNCNALCSASESRKQNLPDITLDLPFYSRLKRITSLKNLPFHPHQVRVCTTGFGATFAAVFVLNYWLKEFLLSAFVYRFELRCEPKQLMLLYYKMCPCYQRAIKTGIKCFGRFLLVANGRKPSKSRFDGPIRQRISEEDRRNLWRFF